MVVRPRNVLNRDEPDSPEPVHKAYQVRILQALRRITRATAVASRKLASLHGITAPQVVCLIAVAEHGPLSNSALSGRVHLSPSTVVGIVDRLSQKGLVTRERSEVDRRRVDVRATDAGRRLVADAPSLLQNRLARGLARLPELQQVAITLALEEVVSLLEIEDIPDAAPILDAGPLTGDGDSEPQAEPLPPSPARAGDPARLERPLTPGGTE